MKNNYQKPLMLLINTTAWIVGPVIIGAVVGKWLDQKFNSEPWLFLITIGVCFLISMFGLIVNALKEFKKIEEETKNNKDKEQK